MIRLNQAQILAIAPRILPFKACACGCVQVRINPELVDGPTGPVVEVKCTGCGRSKTFLAVELGLVPAVADRETLN